MTASWGAQRHGHQMLKVNQFMWNPAVTFNLQTASPRYLEWKKQHAQHRWHHLSNFFKLKLAGPHRNLKHVFCFGTVSATSGSVFSHDADLRCNYNHSGCMRSLDPHRGGSPTSMWKCKNTWSDQVHLSDLDNIELKVGLEIKQQQKNNCWDLCSLSSGSLCYVSSWNFI